MNKKKNELQRSVMQTLRARSRRTADLLSLLLVDWPIGEEFILNLILYITDRIKVNGEPILYQIIDDGLQAYEGLVYHNLPEKHSDDARFNGFIEGLTVSAVRNLKKVRVESECGAVWHAGLGIYFFDWAEGKSFKIITAKNDQFEGIPTGLCNLVFGNKRESCEAVL